MRRRRDISAFGWTIDKECGGRWFPGIGRGRWDGWHYFLFHDKKINIKPEIRVSRWDGKKIYCLGPLMLWKD